MFEILKEKFKVSDYSKRFPVLSVSIASGLAFLLSSKSYRNILFNPISFIKLSVFEDESVPFLESQKKEKPVILFDFNNFLSCDKFSLARFDYLTYKRAFCEEFLFNIAYYYEIICVSDRLPSIGHNIIESLDPLSCISYRIFLRDKKMLDSRHFNRSLSKLMVVSSSHNEFHRDFDQNLIKLPKYTGNFDSSLLDLMHFFINVHYMNLKDVRSMLQSYKNCDFIETFKTIQRKLFNQRNLLSFGSFENKVKEINSRKIEEYKNMKAKIKKTVNNGQKSYRTFIFSVLKNMIL
ncbi:uncharacterized protein VICG_00009 [Vittaforma corneae ATCC 50505]|uniref:FCP1 homology domain-containing protein n=1 Tax=Vittaforma corneae (strain ATCC 50505) TaxID=993615 RepID=L2GQ17_VITCO|nr:uncharacterized protein VICG_00009 [Vittaforma corneae ATCC 50505]ELA42694.1 hypothetical protein VICG_00009 [Vittaforma corneae ATCC 50505]